VSDATGEKDSRPALLWKPLSIEDDEVPKFPETFSNLATRGALTFDRLVFQTVAGDLEKSFGEI